MINEFIESKKIGGNPQRPFMSNVATTVTVGSGKDYSTIQEALDNVPLHLFAPWRIEIDDGTYDEDLIVWPSWGCRLVSGGTEVIPLVLTGNQTTPSSVKINSLFIQGLHGDVFAFAGFEVQGSNPYDNETVGIIAYGSREVQLHKIKFAGGTFGIKSYASQIMLSDIDFGTDVLSIGAITKHGGSIVQDPNLVADRRKLSGSVTDYVFRIETGQITYRGTDNLATGTNGVVEVLHGTATNTQATGTNGVVEVLHGTATNTQA